MPFTFHNVLIIGLGLIGSSIAQALTKNNIANVVSAFDLNGESLDDAIEIGIIDYGFSNLNDAVKNQDLIIICTPIGTYEAIIDNISPHLNKKTILSDVGSVKGSIIKIISKKISNIENFVPAHPIAGSEKSGLLAGNSDLFKNKDFIITPIKENSTKSIQLVKELWERLGSNVIEMDYKEHDEIYAKSSHIPHLITFCYASFLIKKYNKSLKQIADEEGNEFVSFIRLAFSNPKMWTDIFIHNKEPIIKNVEKYFTPPALKTLDDDEDISNLNDRIIDAKSFRKTIGIRHKFSSKMNHKDIYTGILPKVICCLIIESVDRSPKVGGGFLGLTENIINLKSNFCKTLEKQLPEYNEAISLFANEITHLTELIRQSNGEEIYKYIDELNR